MLYNAPDKIHIPDPASQSQIMKIFSDSLVAKIPVN